jgi:hypothetical protein
MTRARAIVMAAVLARVCACRDATCVNAAMDALADKPTKEQRKAEAIALEITNCVAQIYAASDAAPDDAAPDDAEPAPAPGDAAPGDAAVTPP